MLYELILINEIEQRAKIIFLSVCSVEQKSKYLGCFLSFKKTNCNKCIIYVVI